MATVVASHVVLCAVISISPCGHDFACTYAGSDAAVMQVTVTLREVYEWRLPELTLAMCQKVSEEVESIDQYKEQCRQAIKNDASIELQVRNKPL